MPRTLFLENEKLGSERLSSVSVTEPGSWEAFKAAGVRPAALKWLVLSQVQLREPISPELYPARSLCVHGRQSSSPSLEGSSNAPFTPKWNVSVAFAELTFFWRILASWACTPTLGLHESSRGAQAPQHLTLALGERPPHQDTCPLFTARTCRQYWGRWGILITTF